VDDLAQPGVATGADAPGKLAMRAKGKGKREKEEAGPSPIRASRVWAQDDNKGKSKGKARQGKAKQGKARQSKAKATAEATETPAREPSSVSIANGPRRQRSRRDAGATKEPQKRATEKSVSVRG
jgi:hypothetical protein